MRYGHPCYQSNKIKPSFTEQSRVYFGLVEINERLVFLTTVKFVLEKFETETVGESLKIPRKSFIIKSREVLTDLNQAV